jgi:hypothetical protein
LSNLFSSQEEEERYLSTGTLGAAGQNIMSGGTFGQTGFHHPAKTIGSVKNRQINYSPEHTFFNTQTHMSG